MTRIVDYTPSDEQSLVSRILLTVHKAADDAFPAGHGVQRQYAKTIVANDGHGLKKPEARPAIRPVPPALSSGPLSSQSSSAFSSQARPFTGTHDDREIDYLLSEKQKSRKLIFFAIVMATGAFVALALLISSRNFR